MKNVYWNIRVFDTNKEKRTIDSPLFANRKEAELWKMKYIIDHPDDRILFDLMNENGQTYVTDFGSVVSEMWTGNGY